MNCSIICFPDMKLAHFSKISFDVFTNRCKKINCRQLKILILIEKKKTKTGQIYIFCVLTQESPRLSCTSVHFYSHNTFITQLSHIKPVQPHPASETDSLSHGTRCDKQGSVLACCWIMEIRRSAESISHTELAKQAEQRLFFYSVIFSKIKSTYWQSHQDKQTLFVLSRHLTLLNLLIIHLSQWVSMSSHFTSLCLSTSGGTSWALVAHTKCQNVRQCLAN